MRLNHQIVGFFSIFLLLIFVSACGDDVVGDGSATNSGSNGGQSEEDCGPGEEFNPISNECVTDDGGDNNNDTTNNDNNNDTTNNDNNNDTTNNDNNNDTTNNGECGPGHIEGQTCRPNGTTLAGATVSVVGEDCDGNEFSETTTADENGMYSFYSVDSGSHTVEVESGSFSGEQPVTVHPGETTQLLADGVKACVSGNSVNIAVVQGEWDEVDVLLEGMDIEFDYFTGNARANLLNDLNAMQEYDIIFLECGTLWTEMDPFGFGDMSTVQSNILNYVQSGKSLYASDQAQAFIQMSIPEAVEFYNEGSGVNGPRVGDATTVTADVLSPQMQSILPNPTTEISFDLPSWSVATGSASSGTEHFVADVPTSAGTITDAPLMITYPDPVGGGRVIYTSFHNSEQASGDMEDILEFMIFQL